jgi:hypothetical protein
VRHQIFLLAGAASALVLLAYGCSFPDYKIVEPAVAGGAGAPVQAGAGNAAGSSGTAGSAEPADGGGAGTAGGGSSGAQPGGNGGDDAGTPPRISKKCADYQVLPPDCTCSDDATHAYAFCPMTRPFTTAAAQCSFYDMHLVSIEGAIEDAFITEAAALITQPSEFGYFWIGGSTIGSHGTWHWPDGSVFWTGGASGTPNGDAYFNWRTDSPQNTGTDSCAFSDDQGWQDGDCTNNRPYVCEAN